MSAQYSYNNAVRIHIERSHIEIRSVHIFSLERRAIWICALHVYFNTRTQAAINQLKPI